MTRDELEQLDTRSLRALARRRLAGASRPLRSRASLLAALTRALASPGPAVPAMPPPKERRAGATPGATVGRLPTSSAAPRTASSGGAPPRPEAARVGPGEDGPVEEGFFLLQKARRRAARPLAGAEGAPQEAEPPRAAEPPPPPGEEVPYLLARDATTLFLFWDFRRDLERGAAFGLHAPRVLFRLYDGEVQVRSVEVPLARRSLYLEGLEPGHLYSVEAWLAGKDGQARPTGRRSAAVRLAPVAPSPRMDVEMVRVPFDAPLATAGASAPLAQGGSERLAPPSRVELPASLDWRGGAGPKGPGSGRP